MENLQIGTYGWQHAQWQEAFYPEGLPEEWQLDYYSNAFRVVLVPQAQWLGWDEDEIEEALEAVEGDFGFYLAINDTWDVVKNERLKCVQAVFGKALKGLVVFSDQWQPDALIEGLPVSLVSKSLSLSGWSWQHGGLHLSGQPFGYVENLSADGREQAALLRDFMATLPQAHEGAAFFIGGESINMTQVTNLKTVGELLGY